MPAALAEGTVRRLYALLDASSAVGICQRSWGAWHSQGRRSLEELRLPNGGEVGVGATVRELLRDRATGYVATNGATLPVMTQHANTLQEIPKSTTSYFAIAAASTDLELKLVFHRPHPL